MRTILYLVFIFVAAFMFAGCWTNDSAETQSRKLVDRQQDIYNSVQAVHIYDFSIPRDIYQQIYDITTTEAIATYTAIETMTGVTKYECPSFGYAIPADSSLTNPVQGTYNVDDIGVDEFSAVIEQAEPNGLFSSRNTDGTWVLCVDLNTSEVYPVYSEHKLTTWPFIVQKDVNGQYHRADNSPVAFRIIVNEEPPDNKK